MDDQFREKKRFRNYGGMSWRKRKYYIDISVSWLKWRNRCIVTGHCRSLICRKLIQNLWQTSRQIHQLRTLYNGSQILLSYRNNANKYKLISFQDIDVDWVMPISEQAFVPISSTYKKQTAKSHSRTEAEIIFLKTHLWMHDSHSSIVWEMVIVGLESLDSFYDIWDNPFPKNTFIFQEERYYIWKIWNTNNSPEGA